MLAEALVFIGISAFLWYLYKLYKADKFASLSSTGRNPPSRGNPTIEIHRGYYHVDERKKKK